MTILYVVVDETPGYCREDASTPACAGVYTDPKTAETVAKITLGTVVTIELDYISPGYFKLAEMFGYKL